MDLLSNFIDKTISNGSGNVYQKRKASVLKRIKELRKRMLSLPYDKRFNPNYSLTRSCIEDITRSKGVFHFDFQSIKEINMDEYEVLKDDSIEDFKVLYYFADIPTETFTVKKGKMQKVETSKLHVNSIAFEEEKLSLEEEYIESMQEYANDVIDEISSFFDGTIPKDFEEAEYLLEERGYPIEQYEELHKALEVRYNYLKSKTIKNRENIELYTKKLSTFKKRSKIKPTKKETKEVKTGLFSRLRKDTKFEKSGRPREEKVKIFDSERERQMAEDNELIDVIIYQRRIINGKEERTELSNKEYKVVRR